MVAFTYPWALLLALPSAWLLWRSRRPSVETHAVANLFLWSDASAATATSRNERRAMPPWLVWLQAAVIVALSLAIAGPQWPSSRPVAALVLDASPSMAARDTTSSRADLARVALDRWRAAQSPRANTVVIEATDLGPAIASARQQTDGPVTVITDLPAPSAAGELGVAWLQVGAPVDNVGITTLAARADGGAILEVTNFGGAPRSVSVTVVDGATTRVDRFDIEANGLQSLAIGPGPDRNVSAEIRLEGGADSGNALVSDDRRSIAIRGAIPVNLVLANDEALVGAAVRALPDVTVETATAQARTGVWVCPDACAAPAGAPRLVFRSGGAIPKIDRRDDGGERRITVSVDLKSSPWPLTPAFPIFVADAIDWLSSRPAASLTAERLAAINESNTRSPEPPALGDGELTSTSVAAQSLWLPFAAFALGGALIDLFLRRRAAAIRVSAAIAVGAALAGLALPIGRSNRVAVALLDASASVAGNSRAANDHVRRETADLAGSDQLRVIRFGGAATDIAGGIRVARAALPATGDRRILLVTDGQQTTGDAEAEARHAGEAGVAIDVTPIDTRLPAYIERFEAPLSARANSPLQLRIWLKGRPREIVGLAVSRDGRPIESRRVALDDAGAGAVSMIDSPPAAGVSFYRAMLSDEQLGVALSESGVAVTIAGRARVLVISERGAFRQAVGPAPFELIDVLPAAVPDTRDALAAFSAFVLDAIAPHKLSARQQEAIAAAVAADGAGLLLLGGRDSLDASDFASGAFADLLPLDFTALPNPPSASTSIALLVDISGSMASTSDGVTKISAARDAITRTLTIMPKTDAVTVVGFAAGPTVLIAPGDSRDAAAVTEKLKRIEPSGSTSLAPAVSEAVRWLKSTANRRRRLLLVTDGKTSVSDADATRRAVLGEGIEVSAITIGNDAEREWLAALASATGGRAFFPERLSDLAREVAREASRGATGREVIEEFTVRGGAHPLAPAGPAPSLGGYIAARLRDGATAAWKSRSDDAVLAAWPRGLGRVAVFTGDLGGAWSTPLRRWSGQSSFWQRAIHWAARSSESDAIDAALTFAIDGPRVVVELPESTARSGTLPAVRVSLAGPSGQISTVPLHAVSPTRFEAPAPLADAGEYRATISVIDASGAETRAARGWFWSGDLESQSRSVNIALLQEIARASGGRLLPPLGSPITTTDSVWSAPRAPGRVNAVPWLMLAALALLSYDYIRRATEIETT